MVRRAQPTLTEPRIRLRVSVDHWAGVQRNEREDCRCYIGRHCEPVSAVRVSVRGGCIIP